ncbi:MAG: CHAT domain-containing protein, partial [Chitinophagaceae bacterium]
MAAFIPYILSIFSTPPKGITGHLKFLEAEKKSLLKIFETLKSAPDARSAFNVDYDPLDDDTDEPLGYQAIAERIDTFRLRNTIIHFSGHANMVNLSLQKEDIRATTFIKCLSQCEGLKVVVLNACSTQGFVRTILETTEVKAVIATTNPVGDETAMRFAENFYKKLAQREPLAAAFTYAVSRAIPNEFENDKYLLKVMVDAKNKLAGANQLLDDKGAQATRGIKKNISNILDKDDEPATWGLYTKSDQILDWRLFEPLTSAEVQNDVLAAEKKKLATEKLGYKAELVEPEADLIYFGNLFKNNPTDITAKNKIEKAETL